MCGLFGALLKIPHGWQRRSGKDMIFLKEEFPSANHCASLFFLLRKFSFNGRVSDHGN